MRFTRAARLRSAMVLTWLALPGAWWLALPGAVLLHAQPARHRPLAELEMAMRRHVEAVAARFAELPRDEVLRLTLTGEPEELVPDAGFTPGDWEGKIVLAAVHAHDSRATGALWLLPSTEPDSAAEPRVRGTYRLRFEGRTGECLDVLIDAQLNPETGRVAWSHRQATRCVPWVMAETIRRSRRVARLPFAAGDLNDSWSVAVAARGTVDVYLDSVVVVATKAQLRVKPPNGVPVPVDSLSAGLAVGEGKRWSVARHGNAVRIGRTFKAGEEWSRGNLRFTIPIDDRFELGKAWPVFELHLSVPKTRDNPYGFAWTYAHEKEGYFKAIHRSPEPER